MATEPLKIADINAYFSGKHYIQIDKGSYKEPMPIPGVPVDAVKQAVSAAVKLGRVWLVTPAMSVVGEDVPVSLITDDAQLYAPSAAITPTELLPDALPAAWAKSPSNAHMIHVALSTKAGKTLPWATIKAALDDAFRLGLFERTLISKDWPTDLGGAAGVEIIVAKQDQSKQKSGGSYGAKVGTAELETNEIQDLADAVSEIKKASAGQSLRFKVTVELGDSAAVSQGAIDQVNALLAKVKSGWKLG